MKKTQSISWTLTLYEAKTVFEALSRLSTWNRERAARQSQVVGFALAGRADHVDELMQDLSRKLPRRKGRTA